MKPITKMIKHLLPLILLLSTLTQSYTVLAQTDVSGTIVNGNWTSNNSPYIVVGNINVAGLTINPGVTVSFATNYAFEVDGVLTALGTPNAPIVFTGTNGGWQGIYFNYSSPGSVLQNCIIANSINSGILIASSTPSISACTISNNSASCNGGGISSDTPLTLNECSIIGNVVSCVNASGAGIYSTAPLILNYCLISDNKIVSSAPSSAAYSQGAGIYCSTNITLKYCLVTGNSGSVNCPGYSPQNWGGGIYCGTILTMQNSIVRSNSTSTVSNPGPSPSYAYGGGVFTAQLFATNSIFDYNSCYADGVGSSPSHGGYSQGAGIYLSSTSQVVNCTIAYNSNSAVGSPPVTQGAGIYSGASSSNTVQIMNSILWANATDQIYGDATVDYSDVQNGFTGTGNINNNPIFLSTTDLIIVPGSPCINAGNTNAIYNNVYFPPSLGQQYNDMGADGGPGAGAIFQIESWPQIEVLLFGGVPGYTYQIQASTNLLNWQTVEQFQIANVGDITNFFEPSTNTLPHRFYKLNLAP
jgi:predicted outer membrane repeat protein